MPGLARVGNRGDTGGMSDNFDATQLPIFLRQSRRKWIVIAIVCWVFVPLIVATLGRSASEQVLSGENLVLLIAMLFLLLLGFIATFTVVRPGTLSIDRDGLRERMLGRDRHYAWEDVDNFHTVSVPRNTLVMFDLNQDGKPVRNFNTKTGYSAGTLSDSYGLDHDALASLLQTVRDRQVV